MKAARGLELADLSEEMIVEIFVRLPARTLVSLKSICTSWRNLISSPDFTRNHFRRSCLRDPTLTPPRFAYITSVDVIESFSMQSMFENPPEPTKVARFSRGPDYRIVGSCHGLLCFLHRDAKGNMDTILWNPCTGFIFESPQISGQVYFPGFGYDHLSDTYKFYSTITKKVPSGVEYSAIIYTFEPTSSWRKIDKIPYYPLVSAQMAPYPGMAFPEDEKGVFFGSSKACTINWRVDDVVVYFDLGKETYSQFFLPYENSDHYTYLYVHLCVLKNCLSICYQHMETLQWMVWQMKEYGDYQSWTKLAVIPIHPKFTYLNLYHGLQPFYISINGVLLALSPSSSIIFCNLKDACPDFSQNIGYRMTCIYHESLLSPNGLQSNSSILRLIKPKPLGS